MITSKNIALFLYDTTDELSYQPDENKGWHVESNYLWFNDYCMAAQECFEVGVIDWYIETQPKISYPALVDLENIDSEDAASFLEHYYNLNKDDEK